MPLLLVETIHHTVVVHTAICQDLNGKKNGNKGIPLTSKRLNDLGQIREDYEKKLKERSMSDNEVKIKNRTLNM